MYIFVVTLSQETVNELDFRDFRGHKDVLLYLLGVELNLKPHQT